MIDVKAIGKGLIEKINAVQESSDERVCGRIVYSGDGVVRISGLNDARYNELLQVHGGYYALALNLEEKEVGAVLFSGEDKVRYGDLVYSTGQTVQMPVGEAMLGRIVDPLGKPIDGLDAIETSETRPVEFPAPAIMDRGKVNKPLQTGILAIDSMIPIGRGQRELIIGDRQTGKTAIAVDTILNQKGEDVICIYVSIGQKASSLAKTVNTLRNGGAMDYTCIVCSTADDSVPMQYIAPYSGCALAEYFMYQGKDVLIVYDDLSKHAVAYRTMSLLLKRPAGREAYPGDVFYLHSRLLERAAKLSEEKGGGSITALPIVETLAGDISAYIPPTSSPSPTGRSIWRASCSTAACARRSTSACPYRAWAAAPSAPPSARSPASCASTWRSTGSWPSSCSSAPTSTPKRRRRSAAAPR